jgi:predicted DNA-binding transcriptional regulator AlpA
MHDITDPILSEEELAKWLDTSRPTLQRQRSVGSGPPFVQLSERRIGYRKSAVERWLEARTINRVGALVAPGQALEKPATQPAPAPAGFDDANTATRLKPPSNGRVRRAGT